MSNKTLYTAEYVGTHTVYSSGHYRRKIKLKNVYNCKHQLIAYLAHTSSSEAFYKRQLKPGDVIQCMANKNTAGNTLTLTYVTNLTVISRAHKEA